MARLFVDGSSQYLTATLANAITTYPITLFSWGFDNNGGNNDRCLLQLSPAVSTQHFMRLGRNDSDQTVRAVNKYGSGSPPKAISTATYSTNTWFAAAAEFANDSSRFAFLDGVRSTEDTTTDLASISNITEVTIGIELADTGDGWDGFIAESAAWNAVLTDAEHEALAAGYSPKLIRPDALIFYCPMVSGASTSGTGNATDLIEGLVMVDNNGVGLADHPPIIYNSRPQIFRSIASGGGPTTTPKSTSYTTIGTSSLSIVTTFLIQPDMTAIGTLTIIKTISKFFGILATGVNAIQKTVGKLINTSATGTTTQQEGIVVDQAATHTATGTLATATSLIISIGGTIKRISKSIVRNIVRRIARLIGE